MRVQKAFLSSLLLQLLSSAAPFLHLAKGDLTLEATDQYTSIQNLRGAAAKSSDEHRNLIYLEAFNDPKIVLSKRDDSDGDIEYVWHRMSPSRREEALEEVSYYLKAIADILTGKQKPEECNLSTFGDKGGAKELCDFTTQPSSCNFISFGISSDYSFDVDLARKKKCKGFAADPTVVHPSRLIPLVTFHNIGAKMLHSNYQHSTSDTDWWITSVPSLRKFLNLHKINVLKMDCEGCEYSLARDIVLEEGISSDFFHRVDQFSLEVHMSKVWVDDKETFYYLGLLYKLMDEAGLKLRQFSIDHCSPTDESVGCMPEFMAVGYPACPAVCHNYLFAKKNLDVGQE